MNSNLNKQIEKDEVQMEQDGSMNPASLPDEGRLTRSGAIKGRVAVIRVEKLDRRMITTKPGPKSRTMPQQDTAVAGPSKAPEQEKDVNVDDTDIDSDIEEVLLHPPLKRRRGRSETTGAYQVLKRERAECTMREEEIERATMNPAFGLSDSKALQRMKCKSYEVMEDLKEAPNVEVAAQGISYTDMLMKTVIKAKKGLKGTVKAEMKEAATYLEAAITVLCERITAKDAGEQEGSNDQLRKQVRALRAENAKVNTELARILVQLKGLIVKRETAALREKAREVEQVVSRPTPREGEGQTPANAAETPMEVETAGEKIVASSPSPMRPPVKGVSKELINYPPQIKSEQDKATFDEMTGRLHELLQEREFMQRCQTSTKTHAEKVKSSSPLAHMEVVPSVSQLVKPTAAQCITVTATEPAVGEKKRKKNKKGGKPKGNAPKTCC